MFLRNALGGEEDVDPTRPIVIGPHTLGVEAAAEAAAILSEVVVPPVAAYVTREFRRPIYWSVNHITEGQAEIFGFPSGWTAELPTAIEVALVRTIAALPPDQHQAIFAGGAEVVLGPEAACAVFRKAASASENPMAGESTEFDRCSSAIIAPEDGRSKKVALDCLVNSYATSPLKFRFLELYRVMEALFLADVKSRLMANFAAEPTAALAEAMDALKSELRQITSLAEPHRELFEECWTALNGLKNTNRFATALFKRVQDKGVHGQGKWKSGAALIYQIRCAVVHAGEKDMIFENFADGDEAIQAILPTFERAALLMLGITLA